MYVFEVQARLNKSDNDLGSFCKEHKIRDVEVAMSEVENNMKQTGLIVDRDPEKRGVLLIQGN